MRSIQTFTKGRKSCQFDRRYPFLALNSWIKWIKWMSVDKTLFFSSILGQETRVLRNFLARLENVQHTGRPKIWWMFRRLFTSWYMMPKVSAFLVSLKNAWNTWVIECWCQLCSNITGLSRGKINFHSRYRLCSSILRLTANVSSYLAQEIVFFIV